eukprot:822794-Pyramimonas_sp.AAC.1
MKRLQASLGARFTGASHAFARQRALPSCKGALDPRRRDQQTCDSFLSSFRRHNCDVRAMDDALDLG